MRKLNVTDKTGERYNIFHSGPSAPREIIKIEYPLIQVQYVALMKQQKRPGSKK